MTTPDLTGIRIIHRAMRGDLHRLVALTEHLVATTPTRAKAIAHFVGRITHTIHQHHTREDEIVWPLIERSAGAAADLNDLSEDHSLLDPLLNEADTAAAGVRRRRRRQTPPPGAQAPLRAPGRAHRGGGTPDLPRHPPVRHREGLGRRRDPDPQGRRHPLRPVLDRPVRHPRGDGPHQEDGRPGRGADAGRAAPRSPAAAAAHLRVRASRARSAQNAEPTLSAISAAAA